VKEITIHQEALAGMLNLKATINKNIKENENQQHY